MADGPLSETAENRGHRTETITSDVRTRASVGKTSFETQGSVGHDLNDA